MRRTDGASTERAGDRSFEPNERRSDDAPGGAAAPALRGIAKCLADKHEPPGRGPTRGRRVSTPPLDDCRCGPRVLRVFIDSGGARMQGTQKLLCELTVREGRVVYDLNGVTREDWDKQSRTAGRAKKTASPSK